MLSFEQTSPATIANFTAPFAGLDNYRFILHDPTSRAAIVHTFEFTAGSLLGQFVIGFALALLFSLRFPGRTLARSLDHRPLAPASDRDRGHVQVPVPGRGRSRQPGAHERRPVRPPDPVAERPASGPVDDPHRQHLARGAVLHPPALQRAPGRAGGGQGGGRSSTAPGPGRGSASSSCRSSCR